MPTIEAQKIQGNEKLAKPPAAEAPARARPRPQARNRITIEGWIFISLVILIGLAAINTGTNLLYLVLSVMLAMMLISGLLAQRNLRRLAMERYPPGAIYAGEPAQGAVELINNKRFINTFSLGLEDELTGPHESWQKPRRHILRTFAPEIGARQRAWCPMEYLVPERGVYQMRRARLVSRYPFGFFEHVTVQHKADSMLVYPRLLPTVAVLKFSPRAIGEIENNRRGMGVGLYGLRNYEVGDSVRLIHWKQSAKGLGIKVKEFEEEVNQSYQLMLDLRCPADPPAAMLADFEKAVSVAASLARHLLLGNTALGLWTSAGNIPVDVGQGHLHRIMRALATVQPQRPDEPPAPAPRDLNLVTQVWIHYQGGTGGRTHGPRPGRSSHVIDVRRLHIPEPLPAHR